MASFENQVNEDYFKWLYNYVCEGKANKNVTYKKLFNLLHNIEFTFLIRNDVNRARDGVDLRYRYAMNMYEDQIDDIMNDINNRACSVLEMIIALAIRCEETIMDDVLYGNRTKQWFWNMLRDLGISYMTDDIFDKEEVTYKINTFLNRDYSPDGKGGLFHIRGCKDDLREVEIWTQLCWYLDNFT